MDAPLAVAGGIREAGVVLAALAAAGAFVLRDGRGRAVAVLASGALVPALLVADLWDAQRFRDALAEPLLIAGVALALALMVGFAVLFLRWPAALPVAIVAALPFRVPLEVGGQSANLLVPLYLVLGGGCLAYAVRELRSREGEGPVAGGPDGRPDGRAGRLGRLPGLELLLAAAVLVYAVQSLYSTDFDQALRNVVFFYVPFALLLRVLLTVEWSAALVSRCLAVVAGLAIALAAVGFWEYASRRVLLNPNAAAASEFQSFFRVNSLFFDPNAYGQFLAIVMLLVAALLLWTAERRRALAAAAILAVLWAALVLTFSQSSFSALLVGLLVLAALRWSARAVLGAALAAALAAALLAVAVPGLVGLDSSSERANEATSGRFRLVSGGLEMFADRPLWGYGSGSFAERFRAREPVREFGTSISHTAPVTIAAEQGVVGLLIYGLVLVAAARVFFRRLGGLRSQMADGRWQMAGEGRADWRLVARGAVAAAAVALLVHTLFYGAFLENPLTWALAAVAVALGRSPLSTVGSTSGEALSPPQRPAPAQAPPPTPAAP